MQGGSDAITQAIAYLCDVQATDGSFLGQASNHQRTLKDPVIHYTSFFTSLIVCSLQDEPQAAGITRKAADFLLSQKSADWSWNYWIRDSPDDRNRPYPDDLDDTACALAALRTVSKHLVGGEGLARFAHLLISQETTAGGPYRTWLVNETAARAWRDVDPAVNANIAYALRLNNTSLTALNEYLDACLNSNTLDSRYYVGTVPTLYFIARALQGKTHTTLQRHIITQLNRSIRSNNALHLALLISAGKYAGITEARLKPALTKLLSLQSDGHWKAHALYYEPSVNNTQYYAGSPALTTAFAIESITAMRSRSLQNVNTTSALLFGSPPSDPVLNQTYQSALQAIIRGDTHNEILRLADTTSEAIGYKLNKQQRNPLNTASHNGWAAYSLYDHVLDTGNVSLISAANVAHRRMLLSFVEAMPEDTVFINLIERTLNTVDAANLWELTNTRVAVHGKSITITTLPNYGNFSKLAERSWGHVLVPLAVLQLSGHRSGSRQARLLRTFFKHYIIARQLTDDAHDWLEDLQNGQLSAVVCMLLNTYARLPCTLVPSDTSALQLHFWQHTIVEVTVDITRHCALAREALNQCSGVSNAQPLLSWIERLESGVEAALSGRKEALEFIETYRATDL